MAKVKTGTIKELHFDDHNINTGTEYGMSLLGRSITEVGMGRSLLADKNGVLIAGNKTLEAAAAVGIEKVTIVETEGKEIVVVKRMDLDINEPAGIKAKILDNTVSVHNYREDADVALAMCQDAEIVNVVTYGLKSLSDDDGKEVSFKASNKAVIKIEFPTKDMLPGAEKRLTELMQAEFPGAILSVKGK